MVHHLAPGITSYQSGSEAMLHGFSASHAYLLVILNNIRFSTSSVLYVPQHLLSSNYYDQLNTQDCSGSSNLAFMLYNTGTVPTQLVFMHKTVKTRLRLPQVT